jgi:hypothetical protein
MVYDVSQVDRRLIVGWGAGAQVVAVVRYIWVGPVERAYRVAFDRRKTMLKLDQPDVP